MHVIRTLLHSTLYIMRSEELLHFASMLFPFALVLHFAAILLTFALVSQFAVIITFCGVTATSFLKFSQMCLGCNSSCTRLEKH